MKSSIVFILILIQSVLANAQINLQTYTTATDTFYWKRYAHIPKPEKLNLKKFALSGQRKVLEKFMNSHSADYPQFTGDSTAIFSVKEWKKCLYPMDINGDGLTDIIFSGSAGGESDIVRIYLNRRDSFELVFEDYQYIAKFTLKNKRLTALKTGDVGCCDAYLYFTRDYSVTWENGVPVFIKGKQTVGYKFTEEPRLYYTEPIPFVSKGDTLTLRASAARLNEPFNPHLETFGNIIAKYRMQCRGMLIAHKSCGKGNNWFFVEMMPDVYPSASILYETEKIPTFIRGWISELSVSTSEK
ncbi:MAG: hypothetical protein WCP32_09095 [Bacteroidota bacterium]